MSKPPKMTHEERSLRRERMAKLYTDGRTVSEIATEFGVTIHTVYTAIREFGGRLRFSRASTPMVVARLINTADSFRKIARDFDVSVQSVHQLYQRYRDAGVRMPERKKP